MASAVYNADGCTGSPAFGNFQLQAAAETRPACRQCGLKIVVVIPCYNEEVSIGSIVLRSQYYADNIVVIDDGSQDKTAEVARLAGAEVIRHAVNLGKGAGIKSAFAYAKNASADILVLLDGDGQHNPDEIPLLIEPILKGEADIANGSRFLGKDGHNVPKYRRMGQEILTFMTNAVSRQKLTDSQNGFRAFSKKTFDCFSFLQKGMGIESEMVIEAAKSNYTIKEIQINVRYDVAGSTLNPFVHGFSVTASLLKAMIRQNYFLVYVLCGLVLLLTGTSGLAYLVLSHETYAPYIVIGYTAVSMLSLSLGTLCLFTLLILRSVRSDRTGT